MAFVAGDGRTEEVTSCDEILLLNSMKPSEVKPGGKKLNGISKYDQGDVRGFMSFEVRRKSRKRRLDFMAVNCAASLSLSLVIFLHGNEDY